MNEREFRLCDMTADYWYSIEIPEVDLQLLTPEELIARHFMPLLHQALSEARKQNHDHHGKV